MCKDNEGSEHKFIRSIEAAPEPMCVLSTDQQLLDLERFCTKEEFCIISVDPTFNLGSFYVTPIIHRASSFGEYFFAVVVPLHMALSLVGDGVGVKMRVMLVAGLFSDIDALTLPFR